MAGAAGIAQMVEHLICNQGVAGSIPAAGTIATQSGAHMIRGLVTLLLWVVAIAAPAMSQTLITSASNVRLRSAPGTDAAAVAMLPLGTELSITSPDRIDGWIPVRTLREEEQQGWVDGSLTLPVAAATYPGVVAGLIAARLAREGDEFSARVELLDLIESVLRRDWSPDDAAHLELQRLLALQGVLRTIPGSRSRWEEPVREWVASRSDEIRYNEPGGQWLIRREIILALDDEYRSTDAADEIAWFAVTNGLGGECEGHLVCYMQWVDMLQGEYLRREPDGRYVEEAAARVRWVAGLRTSAAGLGPYYFSPPSECGALAAVITSLEKAVRDSSVAGRVELVGQLRETLTLCP
jgi:Bacterial SH3 domain